MSSPQTVLLKLSAIVAAVPLIGCEASSSEITAYPVQCKTIVQNGQCSAPEYTLRYTTFKVFVNEQNVVSAVEGFPPTRLTQCAVRDRMNWSCRYDDDSAELGFNDGAYFEVTLKQPTFATLSRNVYYVSYTEYLRIQSGLK
jgi:hypothetical protein